MNWPISIIKNIFYYRKNTPRTQDKSLIQKSTEKGLTSKNSYICYTRKKGGLIMSLTQAIFAAGCFWHVQAEFDKLPGVLTTLVGYTGGTTIHPTYEQVCAGQTGHAEAVEICFESDLISYDTLLDIFFKIHNPTTLNRQGPDIGEQYRSAIFYLNEEQKKQALTKIQKLTASKFYAHPIVTQVEKAGIFYPAENWHQKYFQHKSQTVALSQCMAVSPDWTKLTPEQVHILRDKGTEPPFSGTYVHPGATGTFTCAACGNPIFDTDAQFDSKSGWPSFFKARPQAVTLKQDHSHGLSRTEVTCARCHSHLGHVFNDGPLPSGQRYCINSLALKLIKAKL